MPPYEMWLRGARGHRRLDARPGEGCRGSRAGPRRGQRVARRSRSSAPAEGGGREPWALHVLEVEDGRIAHISSFLDLDTGLFRLLGLPSAWTDRSSSRPGAGRTGRTEREGTTVLTDSPAFSGFSVDDADRARAFYEDTLGLRVDRGPRAWAACSGCTWPRARTCSSTRSPTTRRPTFTVLNFPVPDVDAAVDELTARGVTFERYEGMPFDEKGIMRGGGPLIAWFTDPAGNVFSVIQQD